MKPKDYPKVYVLHKSIIENDKDCSSDYIYECADDAYAAISNDINFYIREYEFAIKPFTQEALWNNEFPTIVHEEDDDKYPKSIRQYKVTEEIFYTRELLNSKED